MSPRKKVKKKIRRRSVRPNKPSLMSLNTFVVKTQIAKKNNNVNSLSH